MYCTYYRLPKKTFGVSKWSTTYLGLQTYGLRGALHYLETPNVSLGKSANGKGRKSRPNLHPIVPSFTEPEFLRTLKRCLPSPDFVKTTWPNLAEDRFSKDVKI